MHCMTFCSRASAVTPTEDWGAFWQVDTAEAETLLNTWLQANDPMPMALPKRPASAVAVASDTATRKQQKVGEQDPPVHHPKEEDTAAPAAWVPLLNARQLKTWKATNIERVFLKDEEIDGVQGQVLVALMNDLDTKSVVGRVSTRVISPIACGSLPKIDILRETSKGNQRIYFALDGQEPISMKDAIALCVYKYLKRQKSDLKPDDIVSALIENIEYHESEQVEEEMEAREQRCASECLMRPALFLYGDPEAYKEFTTAQLRLALADPNILQKHGTVTSNLVLKGITARLVHTFYHETVRGDHVTHCHNKMLRMHFQLVPGGGVEFYVWLPVTTLDAMKKFPKYLEVINATDLNELPTDNILDVGFAVKLKKFSPEVVINGSRKSTFRSVGLEKDDYLDAMEELKNCSKKVNWPRPERVTPVLLSLSTGAPDRDDDSVHQCSAALPFPPE